MNITKKIASWFGSRENCVEMVDDYESRLPSTYPPALKKACVDHFDYSLKLKT
jgi:hypothetical protein